MFVGSNLVSCGVRLPSFLRERVQQRERTDPFHRWCHESVNRRVLLLYIDSHPPRVLVGLSKNFKGGEVQSLWALLALLAHQESCVPASSRGTRTGCVPLQRQNDWFTAYAKTTVFSRRVFTLRFSLANAKCILPFKVTWSERNSQACAEPSACCRGYVALVVAAGDCHFTGGQGARRQRGKGTRSGEQCGVATLLGKETLNETVLDTYRSALPACQQAGVAWML